MTTVSTMMRLVIMIKIMLSIILEYIFSPNNFIMSCARLIYKFINLNSKH